MTFVRVLAALEKCSSCRGNTHSKKKQHYFGAIKLEPPDGWDAVNGGGGGGGVDGCLIC